MRLVLIGIFCLVLFAPKTLRAEDKDLVITTWLDNLSYGGVNTAIGIPIAGIGASAATINGESVKVRLDPTGKQFVIEGAGLDRNGAYSTGALNQTPTIKSSFKPIFGNVLEMHESAHAYQAGILGPLYFPTVGIAYLANHDQTDNQIEWWANAWMRLGNTMVDSRGLKIKFETGKYGSAPTRRFGANFVLLERASKTDISGAKMVAEEWTGLPLKNTNPNSVAVANRYGEIGATLEAGPCASSTPIMLEGSLFRRDFLAQWSTVSSAIRLLIDAKQDTGHVVVDLDRKRLDANLLTHDLGVGVQLGLPEYAALDLLARGNAGITGQWATGSESVIKKPGVLGVAGIGGEARLHILDYAEAYYRKDKLWGSNGYEKDSDAIGVATPMLFSAKSYTGSNGKDGAAMPIYGGVERRIDRESFPMASGSGSASNRIELTVFSIGGRF